MKFFWKRNVTENNLPRKEWTNIKTILNEMFRYAIRKKYIVENPADKIVISVKFRQVVKKTGKTETYSTHKMRKTYASNLSATRLHPGATRS